MNRPEGGHAVWLAVVALVAACGAPRAYRPDPGPYDRVPDGWMDTLREARLRFELQDADGARELLAPLCERRGELLALRVFFQEVELAQLSQAGGAPDPRAVLFADYETEAEKRPTAEGYVLAARLSGTGEAGLALLQEADALDPRCVWVHYGRAWWNYSLRRFREARESIRTALRLDGGHLPTMRLHATMLAGAGQAEEAAMVLDMWLERTVENPLFAASDRADALLDLAALEVQLDRPQAALAHLEELDPRAVRAPLRAEEVRAAAHEALGQVSQALAAVQRASALAPNALLPLVQRAMLLEKAGDREGERKVWERLLELTEQQEDDPSPAGASDLGAIDFRAALFRLQAHARLAGLERGQP